MGKIPEDTRPRGDFCHPYLPCALHHITHHALNVFLMQYKWTQATLLGLTPEDVGWKV